MAAQLIFPLQFVRQFDGPIDADMVFDTEVNMNEYLSSARRYAGQIATCLEKEGSIYVMSSDLSKWVEIGINELEAAKVIEDDEHRFMTDAEKAKLLSIAPGAQVNIIETISVKGVNVSPIDKNINLSNVVIDSELTNVLSTKADKSTTYTKTQTDSAISEAISTVIPPEVDLSLYATKTEVTTGLSDKADKSELTALTTAEIDSMFIN